MRIVFFGSGQFAAPSLAGLAAGGHDIARVFTQPDRPSGRGRQVHATPVKDLARELGIPVCQPETLKDGVALAALREDGPEAAVVVAYGHLITRRMLAVPEHGFINAHASVLPKYRGAAPVPHAILHGEAETGVTIFRLNDRWDAGDILAVEKTPIGPADTAATVLERLAPIAATLLNSVVGQLRAGWTSPVPQTDAEATAAPKLQKATGEIDWRRDARRIERMTRAFQPWPLAFTHFPHRSGFAGVAVLRAEVLESAAPRGEPGEVLAADAREGIVVRCADLPLRLLTIKPEGRREMTAAEYMRGATLAPGTRLPQPPAQM